MPCEVGAHEAKTHLPALRQRIADGETIVINKQRRSAMTAFIPAGDPRDAAERLGVAVLRAN
jgi:antitoxin (DNA-binding transcriptional repressor) of toxin-antitoxin stability system